MKSLEGLEGMWYGNFLGWVGEGWGSEDPEGRGGGEKYILINMKNAFILW